MTTIVVDFNDLMRPIGPDARKYIAYWLLNGYVTGSAFNKTHTAKKTAFKEIEHNVPAVTPLLTRIAGNQSDYETLLKALAEVYSGQRPNSFDFLNDPYAPIAAATTYVFTAAPATFNAGIMPPKPPTWEQYVPIQVYSQNGAMTLLALASDIICWENIPTGATHPALATHHKYGPAKGNLCVYVRNTLQPTLNNYGSSKHYVGQTKDNQNLFTVVFIPEIKYIIVALNGLPPIGNLESYLNPSALKNFSTCIADGYKLVIAGEFTNFAASTNLNSVIRGHPLEVQPTGRQAYSIIHSQHVFDNLIGSATDAITIVLDAYRTTQPSVASDPGANDTNTSLPIVRGMTILDKIHNAIHNLQKNNPELYNQMEHSITYSSSSSAPSSTPLTAPKKSKVNAITDAKFKVADTSRIDGYADLTPEQETDVEFDAYGERQTEIEWTKGDGTYLYGSIELNDGQYLLFSTKGKFISIYDPTTKKWGAIP